MPKVSFVSSVYNRAEYVEASIRSMLAQDYDDFEVVIIDDGSSDDTLKVVKSIKDKRLRVIAQENTGFTKAIIRGVAEARGEYIAIVDGGDICFPLRLAVQAAYLDAHPAVGLVGSWVELEEKRNGKISTVKLALGNNPVTALLKKSLFWHSEVMFRKSVYTQVGGYREVFYYSQDNDLWLRMAEVTGMAIIPQVLHRIIKFENGISTTPEKMAMARTYRALAVFCAQERRAGRPDPVTQYSHRAILLRPRSATLAARLAGDGLKCVVRGQKTMGRNILLRAVKEKVTPQSLSCFLIGQLPFLPLLRQIVRNMINEYNE